jgi:putative selenium metabolism hydrolase
LSEWTREPFGGEIVEGRLYGRGSADMKGALAAMIHGVGALSERSLAGSVVVSASVNEELIEGAALRMVMQRYGADFVIIGEASELDVVRAGRGRAEYLIETVGRPSHASSPHLGINAVHRMSSVIAAIEALPMPSHPFVGNGVMCLTDIISVPYPAHSVVPSGCRATYERRLIPGETEGDVLGQLEEACRAAEAEDTRIRLASTDVTSYTGVRWAEPKWFAPWELPEDAELVQSALAGLRGIDQAPGLRAYQFCTNAAYSAGYASVPTIGYGPGRESDAHVVDESLAIADLLAAGRGYRAIAAALLA